MIAENKAFAQSQADSVTIDRNGGHTVKQFWQDMADAITPTPVDTGMVHGPEMLEQTTLNATPVLTFKALDSHETTGNEYRSVKDEYGTWICDIVKRGANQWNVEVHDGANGWFDRVAHAVTMPEAKRIAKELGAKQRAIEIANDLRWQSLPQAVDTGMQHGPAITLRSCEVFNASGQIIARKIWRWLAQSPDAKDAQDRCCQHRAARLMANLTDASKAHVVGIDFECWYAAYPPISGGAQDADDGAEENQPYWFCDNCGQLLGECRGQCMMNQDDTDNDPTGGEPMTTREESHMDIFVARFSDIDYDDIAGVFSSLELAKTLADGDIARRPHIGYTIYRFTLDDISANGEIICWYENRQTGWRYR